MLEVGASVVFTSSKRCRSVKMENIWLRLSDAQVVGELEVTNQRGSSSRRRSTSGGLRSRSSSSMRRRRSTGVVVVAAAAAD